MAAWAARDGSGTSQAELEALAVWTANLHDYALRAWRVCGAGASSGSGSGSKASRGAGAALVR